MAAAFFLGASEGVVTFASLSFSETKMFIIPVSHEEISSPIRHTRFRGNASNFSVPPLKEYRDLKKHFSVSKVGGTVCSLLIDDVTVGV